MFAQYALANFFALYKSGHGVVRMFFFHIQALVRLGVPSQRSVDLTF